MDLFNDPRMNTILLMANMVPITTGDAHISGQSVPRMGYVVIGDSHGNIFAVEDSEIMFSNN